MDKKSELIGKLKELIKHLRVFAITNNTAPFQNAWVTKRKKLESDISALESSIEQTNKTERKEFVKNVLNVWDKAEANIEQTKERKTAEEIIKKLGFWDSNTDNGMMIKAMEEYAQSQTEKDYMQTFMDDVHQWADTAFGKERTALAPIYHLKKEVDEVIEAMQTDQEIAITELADCFILILNSSSKYGLSFEELFNASKEKMEINKKRKWGKPDENGVCEHIKLQPESKELSDEEIENGAKEYADKNGYGDYGLIYRTFLKGEKFYRDRLNK